VGKQIIERVVTLIIAAFGLMAALAWREVVKVVLNRLLGRPDSILGLTIYAVIITILAVTIAVIIAKFGE